ncbi:protein containing PAS domain S-box [Leptolinea tardivitalis]|nr:protein containing PAS domain S-box [Leptolinea tardivitalis]
MQFVLIIMGAILPFFLLSIYNMSHMSKMEARNAEITAQEQAYIAAREFETIIQNARHILYNISEDSRIVKDRDYCQVYAEAVPYREPTIVNLVVLSTEGKRICSSVPLTIPAGLESSDWFQKLIYGQAQAIVPLDKNWGSAGLFTTVSAAHYNEIGLTDGIVVALIGQDWINSIRNRIQLPPNSSITLVAGDGTVLYRDPYKAEYLDSRLGAEFQAGMKDAPRKGSFTGTGLDKVERFYGFARMDPIYGSDYILVGIPKDKALESVQNLLVQNVIINLIVMILAISFASSFAGTRILRIVDKLVETSKKLASGDLTARTGIIEKEGELGFLAQTFDSTIQALAEKDAERQAAMDEVLRERQYFETLVRCSPDAIAIRDMNGDIQVINPSFTEMFGYSFEEIQGKNFDELINTPETFSQGEKLTAHVKEGGTIRVISKRRRKDGKLIDVDISGVPIMVNGKQVGDFGIYHDITALIEAKQNAEASAKAKADFLANMSHEIRTPLNAVIGMTNLLMDTKMDCTQSDYVETIRTSGEDLLTIINDILDFSKIEAGKLDIESTPFDLADCVDSALQLMAPRAAEKKLELLYLIDQGTPAAFISDPTRLRQVLVNLLSNAIKFTEKGEVFLSVEAKPLENDLYELHFSVADTGIGISEASRSRIFQSFSQADSSTTRKFGGTGLGLSISKRLAENMGGTMWYESEFGKGSTFHFTIKARVAENVNRKVITDCLAISQGKTILVVDDNERNRLILDRQLQSWRMNCIPASSGFQALEILKRITTIDAAIVDMQMPEMDGLMLAQAIREMSGYKKLPLVLLSSLGHQESAEKKKIFSAQLSKPVRPSLLLETLLSVFANRPVVVRENQHAVSDIDQQMGVNHPLRILLADDNVVNQKVATRMLEKIGYRADLAANGLEVLQAVERQPYDLIFMDVQMPEMDGIEASRHLHKLLPPDRLPRIIAMTAHALQGDRERFLAEGMDDYLSKPIQINEMVRALKGTPALQTVESVVPKTKEVKNTSHINWETLDSYYRVMGDDTDAFLVELIQTFLPNAQKLIDDLKDNLEKRDLNAFHRAAHTLKSSSASLGAMQLSDLAKHLELDSVEHIPEDSSCRVDALQRELDGLIPEYQKFVIDKTKK